MRGVRRQRQRCERRLAVAVPQRGAATQALTERDRLQRISARASHPHPLMSVQEQRPQIPQLRRGQPDRRKPILG